MTRAALLSALLFAAPAVAGETAWTGIAPGVAMRLVSADTLTENGTVWMGIEIDMPADTKTYWRIPGESGIPLEIDTRASHGIGEIGIAWPYPRREAADGYLDHAYYGRVLIPFEVELVAEAPVFSAEITLGICSDICIPATASLDLSPDTASPDSANALRIRQALATVPLPHDGEGLLGAAVFDIGRNAILVERGEIPFEAETMIAEIAGTLSVFDLPDVSDDGETLAFPLLGRIAPETLQGAEARFTFDTREGPFEIVRPLTLDAVAEFP